MSECEVASTHNSLMTFFFVGPNRQNKLNIAGKSYDRIQRTQTISMSIENVNSEIAITEN